MWRHSHRRKVLVERGQEQVAKVFDYLLADEVPHVHNGARWGAWLLGGDERAYREKVRELQAGPRRHGAAHRGSVELAEPNRHLGAVSMRGHRRAIICP